MDQKKRYLFLWMLIAGGVFILISGVILAVLNQAPTSTQAPVITSEEGVTRVTISDAKAAFEAGAAVFVDVRDSASYKEAHIPGALLIPLGELSDHLDELDPSWWIITYCT